LRKERSIAPPALGPGCTLQLPGVCDDILAAVPFSLSSLAVEDLPGFDPTSGCPASQRDLAYAGGWALQYGARRVVGVKPPKLFESSDRSLGEKIFVQDRDRDEIVQTVTCHELMYAFTAHLKLPIWLNEGLATLAMEYFLERRIVRGETLKSPGHLPAAQIGKPATRLRVDDPQALVAQYALGYWLTRYVDETQPELLKGVLKTRLEHTALEERLASAYGKERDSF